jgi:hypothetical protein
MRRTGLLAVWLTVVSATGCSTVPEREAEPVPPARAAEPQQVDLRWRERYPASGAGLRFAVDELKVDEERWSVEISVTNDTPNSFELGTLGHELAFGLMLFGTGDVAELEEASREGDLPRARLAETIEPPPPDLLAPGETWSATLSGRGSLADGSYLRVVFGPFVPVGDPPEGMQSDVLWITDRSHRL